MQTCIYILNTYTWSQTERERERRKERERESERDRGRERDRERERERDRPGDRHTDMHITYNITILTCLHVDTAWLDYHCQVPGLQLAPIPHAKPETENLANGTASGLVLRIMR